MIWTLIPVSAIYGLLSGMVFRRFSDGRRVRRTANRMLAHLMEMRLFLDTPSLVLRAQWDLLRENILLLRLLSAPLLILLAVFLTIFPQLDAMYGHAPLRVGESVIVTARIGDGGIKVAPEVTLEAPAGIQVETPGLYAPRDRTVSWRVRPLGRTSGELRVRYSGGMLARRIVAGKGLIFGMRLPFTSPAIAIDYPRVSPLGLNWMVWFLLISGATAAGQHLAGL